MGGYLQVDPLANYKDWTEKDCPKAKMEKRVHSCAWHMIMDYKLKEGKCKKKAAEAAKKYARKQLLRWRKIVGLVA